MIKIPSLVYEPVSSGNCYKYILLFSPLFYHLH